MFDVETWLSTLETVYLCHWKIMLMLNPDTNSNVSICFYGSISRIGVCLRLDPDTGGRIIRVLSREQEWRRCRGTEAICKHQTTGLHHES